jgi:tRNA pseudouridine32 synthase / 23S rRNA pseudouridine746 synthase
MTRPLLPKRPPSINGVGASCVTLPPGHWALLIDFLCERFDTVSRTQWLERMQSGRVHDESGTTLEPEQAYAPLGRVYYYRDVPDEAPIPFEAQILYEDEHLLVVDKPHFLPVMPSGHYLQETVLVRLKCALGIDSLVPIHRIDRDTAGLVLFSKQAATRNIYHALFRNRQVQKLYECLAPWREDISLPLTRSSRIVPAEHFMLQHEVAGEPNAITHIALLQAQDSSAAGLRSGQGVARYALRPVTGKRHQLRVHMAALGLPILGDGLYPVLTPQGQMDFAKPLQLLAKALAFVDPVTGSMRNFESRLELQLGH